MKPPGEVMHAAWMSSACDRIHSVLSAGMGALLIGVHQFGVRWKTVRCAASRATNGMIWTPLEPVPITATRLPSNDTSRSGHTPVWWHSPAKSSRPGAVG